MEKLFERFFRFNPIHVDRLSPNILEQYQSSRMRNLRALQFATAFSLFCLVASISSSAIWGGMASAFLWMMLAWLTFALSFRALFGFYLNQFRIKVVQRFREQRQTASSSDTIVSSLFMAQIIFLFIMPIAMASALINPPAEPPPPAPTATFIPSATPTTTATATASMTPTTTHTPTSTATSTPTEIPYVLHYVDSPRPVALRECPSMDCRVVQTLADDSEIHVTSSDDTWFQIQLENRALVYIPSVLTKPNPATPLPSGDSSS